MDTHPPPGVDLREALYNDCRVGTAGQVQLPREAVTRLHGLPVDLDANLLKANPWFPPAATPEAFAATIAPALARHPVLCHAELRNTGRWLHAIVWFQEPVELRSAADQRRWTDLHKVLISSVPSDPSAPALIALTRPVGSTNSKTGGMVRILKPAVVVPPSLLTEWSEEVRRKPFRTLASVFFGSQRLTPCPYCQAEGSHLDLGDVVGFCYGGPCRHVPLATLHAPFLKVPGSAGKEAGGGVGGELLAAGPRDAPAGAGKATPVITVTEDVVLEIDPSRVGSLTIKLTAGPKGGKGS